VEEGRKEKPKTDENKDLPIHEYVRVSLNKTGKRNAGI